MMRSQPRIDSGIIKETPLGPIGCRRRLAYKPMAIYAINQTTSARQKQRKRAEAGSDIQHTRTMFKSFNARRYPGIIDRRSGLPRVKAKGRATDTDKFAKQFGPF